MFGKSTWAVIGINPDSLVAFRAALAVPSVMFECSQLVSSARSRYGSVDSLGINPFKEPRMDEGRTQQMPVTTEQQEKLYAQLQIDTPEALQVAIDAYAGFFGEGEAAFRINDSLPWFGFWLCVNTQEDVSDINSIKEALAYDKLSCPYKFAGKTEKKVVDSEASGWAELWRSQCPVLLDFNLGRCYIGTSDQDNVMALRGLLTDLGVQTVSVTWKFEEGDWIAKFITTVAGFRGDGTNNLFVDEIRKKAQDLKSGVEAEIVQDPQLSRLLDKFYAVYDPGTGLQAALYPGASVTLYPTGGAVNVADPSDMINLMDSASGKAAITKSKLMIQEVVTRDTKTGVKQYRNDMFTFDLDPNCNLSDCGAAQLRGFDVPGFKRALQRELRKGSLPIAQYWSEWLRLMNEGVMVFSDTLASVLGVDRSGEFGIISLGGPADGVTVTSHVPVTVEKSTLLEDEVTEPDPLRDVFQSVSSNPLTDTNPMDEDVI